MRKLTEEWAKKYKNAGYKIVGNHSAVQVCRFTKKALKGGKHCYKRWYGIQSHRCIQMTPALQFCDFACVFCWRPHALNRFEPPESWDKPEEIVDKMIEAQRQLLSGFGGNPEVDKQRYKEALEPKHVAISLDGEPALYRHLAELILEIKKRGMTAFLVTNGTVPERLQELLEKNVIPTNLYISIYSTNKKDYEKVTRPYIKDYWERINKSLELVEEFNKRGCRTIIRLTLVKGWNMKDAEGYAKLIKKANPKFVELKGYAWLGESRQRLPSNAVPTLEEIKEFAEEISRHTGYKIKIVDEDSVVVCLVRSEQDWQENIKLIREFWNNQ